MWKHLGDDADPACIRDDIGLACDDTGPLLLLALEREEAANFQRTAQYRILGLPGECSQEGPPEGFGFRFFPTRTFPTDALPWLLEERLPTTRV